MDLDRYRNNAKNDWFDRLCGPLGCLLFLGAIVVVPILLLGGMRSRGPSLTPAQRSRHEAYSRHLKVPHLKEHYGNDGTRYTAEQLNDYGRRMNASFNRYQRGRR